VANGWEDAELRVRLIFRGENNKTLIQVVLVVVMDDNDDVFALLSMREGILFQALKCHRQMKE
jgi:hypothetical protein